MFRLPDGPPDPGRSTICSAAEMLCSSGGGSGGSGRFLHDSSSSRRVVVERALARCRGDSDPGMADVPRGPDIAHRSAPAPSGATDADCAMSKTSKWGTRFEREREQRERALAPLCLRTSIEKLGQTTKSSPPRARSQRPAQAKEKLNESLGANCFQSERGSKLNGASYAEQTLDDNRGKKERQLHTRETL